MGFGPWPYIYIQIISPVGFKDQMEAYIYIYIYIYMRFPQAATGSWPLASCTEPRAPEDATLWPVPRGSRPAAQLAGAGRFKREMSEPVRIRIHIYSLGLKGLESRV